MRTSFVMLATLVGLALSVTPGTARADGCYICAAGSADVCRDYCRYTGADTQAQRDRCRRMGCHIGGTASCPQAVNYHVCVAPRPDPNIAWCVAPRSR